MIISKRGIQSISPTSSPLWRGVTNCSVSISQLAVQNMCVLDCLLFLSTRIIACTRLPVVSFYQRYTIRGGGSTVSHGPWHKGLREDSIHWLWLLKKCQLGQALISRIIAKTSPQLFLYIRIIGKTSLLISGSSTFPCRRIQLSGKVLRSFRAGQNPLPSRRRTSGHATVIGGIYLETGSFEYSPAHWRTAV